VLDLSVIVPARNVEHLIDECLQSILRSEPREVIVVDGLSSDRTVELARRYPVHVLSDYGMGVAAARMIGVREARSSWVALIDVDIVLPDGALEDLYEECRQNGYAALQAGLQSVSGPGYWGRALVHHHRSGHVRSWFGVSATVFRRDVLLQHGFDQSFIPGEDIELRWRLSKAHVPYGTSSKTIVTHHFDDVFPFARGQWLADGSGLGRMVSKYGWEAVYLLALPLAAAFRGIALSVLRRQLQWLPYYLFFAVYNYVGMASTLRLRPRVES
jgi:glycosyltransferase involved in cell wall biosynthesis